MTFIFTEVVILQLYSLNEGVICREEKPGALGAEGDKKKASVAESLLCVLGMIISSRTPQ